MKYRKQQGNVHYKARDFAKAITVYGAAIDLATSISCPDASIYLNRASAYMMKLMVRCLMCCLLLIRMLA